MRPRPIRLLAISVFASSVLAFSACGGDDPTGNSGDSLSAAEAEFLVGALFQTLDLIQIPLLETAGPAATPYGELYDDQINASDQCDGGGQTTVVGQITGDVDQEAGTGDINVTATIDFVGCVVPGQITYTVDGDPDIGLDGDITITDQSITIDIALDGAVAFATSDGRSGTCTLDLSVAAGASSTGVNQTLLGTACGASASSFDLVLFD